MLTIERKLSTKSKLKLLKTLEELAPMKAIDGFAIQVYFNGKTFMISKYKKEYCLDELIYHD